MGKRKLVENPPFLDEEERELIELFDLENSESLSGEAFVARKQELRQIALDTMNPAKVQISARLAKQDLSRLKSIAMQRGIPYQTLLSSIVHQYVEGKLKER